MELTEAYARTADWVEGLVANTKADQFDDPTPCAKWTVRDLLAHIVGGTQFFREVMTRSEVGSPTPALADPAAEYRAGADAYLAVLADPATLEGTVRPPFGEMPATAFLGITFTDQLIHGWDLAKATGQDTTIPPDLLALADGFARAAFTGFPRSPEIIDEPIDAGPDASDQERFLAFVGRRA